MEFPVPQNLGVYGAKRVETFAAYTCVYTVAPFRRGRSNIRIRVKSPSPMRRGVWGEVRFDFVELTLSCVDNTVCIATPCAGDGYR
jgi:hypothetical protein